MKTIKKFFRNNFGIGDIIMIIISFVSQYFVSIKWGILSQDKISTFQYIFIYTLIIIGSFAGIFWSLYKYSKERYKKYNLFTTYRKLSLYEIVKKFEYKGDENKYLSDYLHKIRINNQMLIDARMELYHTTRPHSFLDHSLSYKEYNYRKNFYLKEIFPDQYKIELREKRLNKIL